MEGWHVLDDAEKKGAGRGHQRVKWYGVEAGAQTNPATTTSVTTMTSFSATAPAAKPTALASVTSTRKTSTTSFGNPAASVLA